MTSEWTNWAGTVSCRPRQWATPDSETALQNVLADLDSRTRTVRVAGSGYSFSPVVPTGDALVSLENHTGIVDIDEDAGQVTVRAGTRLGDLTAELATHGLALETLPDADRRTVAGAISTGTHGTGSDLGILSTQVTRLRLVTADGAVVECAPDTNPDLFRAAQVSLGALGVISTVTLAVVPAYDLELRRRPMDLTACLDRLDDLRDSHRHVQCFWLPHTETVLVETLDEVDGEPMGADSEVARPAPVGPGTWLSRLSTTIPATAPLVNGVVARSLSESTTVGPSHRLLTREHDRKFTESEWCLPVDDVPAALRELKGWIDEADESVTHPVGISFAAPDEIPLSPAADREAGFLAVGASNRTAARDRFEATASICQQYDGRPHWGTQHTLTGDQLARLYPEWEQFQAVRERMDPDGLFCNDHLRQLFL